MNKRLLIISVIIFLFALYLNIYPFHERVPLKKSFSDFPLHFKGWIGRVHHLDDVILQNLRVGEYMFREYRKGPGGVSIYVGYYGTQKEGAQIHSPRHCLPGSGWFELSERIRSINIDSVGKVSFVEVVYKKGEDREVFIYWYKMKNSYITNEYILKLYMVLNSIIYRRNDAAFIRLSAPVIMTEEDTIYKIEKFMKDFLPFLKDYLPE